MDCCTSLARACVCFFFDFQGFSLFPPFARRDYHALMLYVYKQSLEPIHAWAMHRVGGRNNISPNLPAKYLVLWNVEAIKRDGSWHYIFEFDTRESLELSPLAQLVRKPGQPTRYSEGADWSRWLGDDWHLIDEHVRDEILSLQPPADGAITDVRELPIWAGVGRRLGMIDPAHSALTYSGAITH